MRIGLLFYTPRKKNCSVFLESKQLEFFFFNFRLLATQRSKTEGVLRVDWDS